MSTTMEQLTFEIRHADGRIESTTAHAERVVIGSGAHCDVRLAAGQAAAEHVAIEAHPSGPVVRALAAIPPVMLDGIALSVLPLPALATLQIGGTQIAVRRAVAEVKKQGSALGPAMIAKLLVVAGLFAAIAKVSMASEDAPLAAPPSMPELFAKTSNVCPRTDLAEARAVADEQRANGDGARERSPFDPREARSAVKSYETASACYALTHATEASDDAMRSAKRMREDALLDFRARRLRLERLLLVNDYEMAQQDVVVLRALTEGQQGDFVRWLTAVAQEIKNHKVENAP